MALRRTTKFVFCSTKASVRTWFYIDHEDILKASLKWHEVNIWLLTHKAKKIMFRRMYSFAASQGGGDVTAVVTPAGHSRWSESASSDRLIWFPSVLMLETYWLCELVRKNLKKALSWNHSEAKFELLLRFCTTELDSSRQTCPDLGDSCLHYRSKTLIRATLYSYVRHTGQIQVSFT
jgi:hypothetical protein